MVYYIINIKCLLTTGSINDYSSYKIGNNNLLKSIEEYITSIDSESYIFFNKELSKNVSNNIKELEYNLVINLDTFDKVSNLKIDEFSSTIYNGIIDIYNKYNALYTISSNSTNNNINTFSNGQNGGGYEISILLKDSPSPSQPIPYFKLNYDPNQFPTEVKIINFSKNSIKYHYDFGDGENSILKEPIKVYNEEGIYNIVLTTVSKANLVNKYSQTITIKKPIENISESNKQDINSNNDTKNQNQVDKTANVNETEPEEKATNIQIKTPNDKDYQEEFIRGIGFSPVIYYNSLLIDNSTIDYFSLYNDGFLPCIKLNFRDSSGMIKSKSFPLDDTKIKVFISSRSNNLKSIILDFKITNFNNNDGFMMIDGILQSSRLYNKGYKVYSNSTSYSALKQICSDIGLGFNSNINDSNDRMNWLQNGKKFSEFIESIIERSYISDKTFLSGYIDYYQCFNYIDVEKEMDRDITDQHGINTSGLESSNDNSAKIDVQPLILTNDESMLQSNNYFSKFKVINRSTEISSETGYIQNTAFYDRNKKQLVSFKIDSLSKNENSKIILKGNPNDPNSSETINNNQNHHYLGKLDTSNVHNNYFYTKINNWKNITDLGKIEIEIEMGNPNFNLYQFQKVNLILSNKSPMGGDDNMINTRLSGEWLLIDIEYTFSQSRFYQSFRLVKRELELSKEELETEKDNTNSNYSKELSENTTNPEPSPETTGTPALIDYYTSTKTYRPYLTRVYSRSGLNIITPSIKSNLDKIEKACKMQGITNIFILKAIKANVMKECGGVPFTENLIAYSTTPNSRIRTIFTNRVARFNDAELDSLKKNTLEFSEYIYGYKSGEIGRGMGNNNPGDGYKYRGRGYIQMTGKNDYRDSGKALGKDFLNNPELVNELDNAANTLVWEIKRAFKIICPRPEYNLDIKNPQPISQEQANLLVTNCVSGVGYRIKRSDKGYWVEILNKVDGYSSMV